MGQDYYGINRRPAYDGMDHDASGREQTLINDNPRAKQIEAVTIVTAADSTKYGVEINSIPAEITSASSGATKTTIRDQLIAKSNGSNTIYNGVIAEAKDADELLVTAREGGKPFTISVYSGDLSIAQEQANAVADPVEFGRIVIHDDIQKRTGKLAKAANLLAQEDTLTLVYDAGVDALVEIEVDGRAYKFEHTQATDAATSVGALATQINARLPAETVNATTDGDDLVLTSELAGKPFKVSAGFGTGRDTGVWTHASNAGKDTDLNKAYAGMTVESARKVVPAGSTRALFPANYPMSVKYDKARLRVEVEADIASNMDVYVRLAANGSLDKLGGVRATANTGCVKLEGAKFIRRIDANFAVVEVP
jgi:hypothetical protein